MEQFLWVLAGSLQPEYSCAAVLDEASMVKEGRFGQSLHTWLKYCEIVFTTAFLCFIGRSGAFMNITG